MEQLYYTSILMIDKHMREQFGEQEESRRPKGTDSRPERPSRILRFRLVTGSALHALADAIDPTPRGVPSHQH